MVGLVLCGAAVATLTFSLATPSWWSHENHHDTRIEVGLVSGEVCVGSDSAGYLNGPQRPVIPEGRSACTSQRLADLARRLNANYDRFIIGEVFGPASRPETDRGFALLGLLVLAAGSVSALLLAAAGIAEAAGSRRRAWRGVAALATVTSACLLALALAFVVLAPATIDQMALGLGFTCALAGAAFGIAAGQVLAGEDTEAPAVPAPTATRRGRRALLVIALGLVVTGIAANSRTWWVDDNPTLIARHGLRDGETCWKSEQRCEVETWSSQPEGAGGPRPVEERIAFRASEAAYQLAHLAILVAILLLILLLQGQIVEGGWAPHRILVILAIGFLVAAVAIALGEVPTGIDRSAHRSAGPLLALAGGALLVWGGIAAGRLGRPPRPRPPSLPPARVRAQ